MPAPMTSCPLIAGGVSVLDLSLSLVLSSSSFSASASSASHSSKIALNSSSLLNNLSP